MKRPRELLLEGATLASVVLVLAILVAILADIAIHGLSRLTLGGGIFPAMIGTAEVVILMTLAGVPVGVATAIYLHEYAPPGSRFARWVRVAVQNLAGVPSIVFGLFGLGFFVQFVGGGIDRAIYAGEKHYSQPGLLWAAMTLAVLTLPVVIVATEEALRAVPDSHREAAYALGATRFQVIFTVVLPQATAGILTGTILAVSRGAGEVAPILFTGAAYYMANLPDGLSSQFMHLGYHVYVLSTQSPDVDAAEPLLYSTVTILLGLVFLLNASAIILRSRLRQSS